MCYAWSVSLLGFIFSFLYLFLLFITSLIPSYFVWERNTLHFQNLEHIIGFFLLIFLLLCVLYLFIATAMFSFSLSLSLARDLAFFSLLLELFLVFMFILLKRVGCCTELCLVLKVGNWGCYLILVVTCNSFEVLL